MDDELARRREERGGADAEWEAEMAEARIRNVREARRRAAALPKKWAEQTFDDIDEDDARARARALAMEWALDTRSGLVLWGAVGRGKTALAAAAANRRMEHGAVRWLPVAELLLDLRMPFSSREYERAIRRLDPRATTAALVLDDLDKGKATEHAVEPLYVVINAWIEAELPLLVTLNRDLDELAERLPESFGEAIASRLSGYCATVEVAGRDRRIEP